MYEHLIALTGAWETCQACRHCPSFLPGTPRSLLSRELLEHYIAPFSPLALAVLVQNPIPSDIHKPSELCSSVITGAPQAPAISSHSLCPSLLPNIYSTYYRLGLTYLFVCFIFCLYLTRMLCKGRDFVLLVVIPPAPRVVLHT